MADWLDRFRRIGRGKEPKEDIKLFAEEKQPEHKERILLVDDERPWLNTISDIIKEKFPDLEVETATSGKEAIRKIMLEQGDYAYVSLDIMMPDMTGFEVYKKIKDLRESYPCMRVGFCTAFHGQGVNLNDILNIHGFFGYIVKSSEETFNLNIYDVIGKALSAKRQLNFEKQYKLKAWHDKSTIDDLLLIDTIVGQEAVAKPMEGNHESTILVKKFTNPKEVIAAFYDADEHLVDKAIEECKRAVDYWSNENKISKDIHLKLMDRFGQILLNNQVKIGGEVMDLDRLMCHSNQAAYDVIKNDREMGGMFASRSREYIEWAEKHQTRHERIKDDVKTVAAFIQSSMYQTGPYGIIEALRARKSLIIKLDSKDPIPQYQVGKAFIQAWEELQEEGLIDKSYKAPIQILGWDARKHMNRGAKVIKETDATIFMGNPKKAILIEHGEDLRNIRLETEDQLKEFSFELAKRTANKKVLYYTANKGVAYLGGIKDLNSLEEKVDMIVYSMRSHYRSCKRLIMNIIDDKWHLEADEKVKYLDFYDTAVNMIRKKLLELPIGETGNQKAKVVRVSDSYWDGMRISKYLKTSRDYMIKDRLPQVSEDKHSPALIELNTNKVIDNYKNIRKYLSWECMFPVLNIVKGNEMIADRVMNQMGRLDEPKSLELSIFTDDKQIYERFIDKQHAYDYIGDYRNLMVTNQYSYGLYHNEVTTNGFGTFSKNEWKKRGHQLLSLYLKLRTMEK